MPTPESQRVALSNWVDAGLKSNRERIAKFASSLSGDPAWVLADSDGMFEAAAKIRALTVVQSMLAGGASVANVQAHALRESTGDGSVPRRSPSITNDLMRQLLTVAWGEVGGWIRGEIGGAP